MINVKFSVPTYQANSWGRLSEQGEVQISSDVDSLSTEYPVIKAQVDALLKESGAENRLILDIEALEAKREKMQRDLEILTDNINLAKKQLRRLENFLKRLGIDSKAYTYNLHISNDLALNTATDGSSDDAVEVEVDPIPFDSLKGEDTNPHEF
jgi:hypothetical protein